MISIPYFSPGVSVRSIGAGGSRVTDPQTDPPVLSNGGYNFSNWTPLGGNTFQDVLNWQAEYNARLPLSVTVEGNLVVAGIVF